MSNRTPKRFGGLTGQRASTGIGDGAGNHQRQVDAAYCEGILNRKDGGLGVQGVEHGFDHQQISAAVDQSQCGFVVGTTQLGKGDIAESSIVYFRGQTCRAIRRTQNAGNEARPILHVIGSCTRELGADEVQFVADALQPVVRLGNGGCSECIRLQHVRACSQVGGVNVADDLRSRDAQNVAIAFQVPAVIAKAVTAKVTLAELVCLQHRTHCTVKAENSLFQGAFEHRTGMPGHGYSWNYGFHSS